MGIFIEECRRLQLAPRPYFAIMVILLPAKIGHIRRICHEIRRLAGQEKIKIENSNGDSQRP
ncbi:uncharacterized protein EAF01_006566 [Botrytis porri]|uniref:uncharacterized protein n=1 Tax=Botrytis porri TaxID=87229 RepID=UPI00190209F8|nr:uncharacterized protein EAF01_006566 [Botrytis porri]KAF7903517.1 hypothetical protein EAF01_006566 [Botrytis porri]